MPKNSIFRFDGAKVLTIPTRAELFLKNVMCAYTFLT